MRAILATSEEIGGARRKLGWFQLLTRGLYFEVGGLFMGSHTSYHVDGNVFRTSPASNGKAYRQGTLVPLDDFDGWRQLGISMLDKQSISTSPALKSRDVRKSSVIAELNLKDLPSDTLNIVVELVSQSRIHDLDGLELDPPEGTIQRTIGLGRLNILLSIIGKESQLLLRPNSDGFAASHFNDRFTANAKGIEYHFEAYG